MSKYLKPLLLIGLAFFLIRRLTDHTILFYIHQRFIWLIWAAVGMLLLIVLSHGIYRRTSEHTHELSWTTVGLVSLPVLFGLLIPPQPLGTAALLNRDLSVGAQAIDISQYTLVTDPAQWTAGQHEEALQDWELAFGTPSDTATFVGRPADLTGFVYRLPELPPDTWLLSRFFIWCCVADATPISLMVRAPGVSVANDAWVHVQGHFVAEVIDGALTVVLIADTVTPIEPPAQPYLYPIPNSGTW